MNSFKVVISGINIATNAKVCFIKRGMFEVSQKGAEAALDGGYKDKVGEFPPEFVFSNFTSQGVKKGFPTFSCRIDELSHTGRKIYTSYQAEVVFKSC